jgi:hypothetical protein
MHEGVIAKLETLPKSYQFIFKPEAAGWDDAEIDETLKNDWCATNLSMFSQIWESSGRKIRHVPLLTIIYKLEFFSGWVGKTAKDRIRSRFTKPTQRKHWYSKI